MYIAGSNTPKDWYDDFHLVPFKQTRNATRYQSAHDALMENPKVTDLRGHSLGSMVALELQKNYPNHIKSTRTYGAPVFDILGSESNKVERYRNWFDPFSSLDRSAVKSVSWNPLAGGISMTHDYSNISKDFVASKQVPLSSDNPDMSTSLIG